MPNTPTLALPYPVAADTADVPRDVKALADRLELVVPPDYHYLDQGGPAVNANNGAFTLLPVSIIPNITSTSGAPDFVRNADGTVTIKVAGLFMFTGGLGVNEAIAGAVLLDTRMTVKAGNAVPIETDERIGMHRVELPTGSYPTLPFSGARRCAVNDRVAVYGMQSSGAVRSLTALATTIVRIAV